MIFRLLAAVFLNGISLLIGVLAIMRGLYKFSAAHPPTFSSDPWDGDEVEQSDQPAREA